MLRAVSPWAIQAQSMGPLVGLLATEFFIVPPPMGKYGLLGSRSEQVGAPELAHIPLPGVVGPLVT